MKDEIADLQAKLKDLEGFLKIKDRIEKLAGLEKKTLGVLLLGRPACRPGGPQGD